MEKKRVSTGIPGLDPLIGGGFPSCKSYLVTGQPGTGKSIFCVQFVLNGLMNGEKAVYVAVDEKPADIVEEAATLGWDLLKFMEEKRLLILDASPYFTSRAGSARTGGVDVAKTVGDLASYVKRMEASRVVIDPVGPLISSSDSASATQEHVRTLVHALQDHMGTTNLLTSYNSVGHSGLPGVEEYMVAGVIELSVCRIRERFSRTLLVRKMRGTAIELVEHQFNIHNDKGITLKQII